MEATISETKRKAIRKVVKADEQREEILVALLPKWENCEICKQHKKFVWVLPEFNCLHICPACLVLLRRIEKLPDEILQKFS